MPRLATDEGTTARHLRPDAQGRTMPRVATASQPPSEGPEATSVQTDSPEPLHTTDGDERYIDGDLEKMRKYVLELEFKNAELKKKLEAAQAQLKERNKYINSDPLIDEELRKCHDIFLCPNESDYKKLSEFLADPQSKLTMDVKVHGRKVIQELKQLEKDLRMYIPPGARTGRKPEKFWRMTSVAKYVVLGIIEDIYRLHRHGLSLNGQFTLENFHWTHLKKVKLDPSLKLAVCMRNRDEMIKDYHKIYQIILEIWGSLPVPSDLENLLNLMNCADPIKNQHIIRYNISLMSEIGKKCHFITLYDRLRQLMLEEKKDKSEEKISEEVLQMISSRFGDSWASKALDNEYVEVAYNLRHHGGTTPLTKPLDLLIVWRNGLTHILEDSIEGGAPLFKDEDLVNMLDSVIPGVFNELQRAMNAVGLMELPHLMRAMRM